MKVSVALASYNGEKYIKEQVCSVLECLGPMDELVISDDGSKDETRSIIAGINDPRIILIDGPGKGIKANFDNAIRNTTGDIIFLCDQDDIWMPEKTEKVLKAFKENNCSVVVHDCEVVDDEDNVIMPSFYAFRGSGSGAFKNTVKNTYIGCCMAFKSGLKERILPIPESIEMHDQWIGVWGDKTSGSVFIPDKLIKYRRHGDNASSFKHYGIWKMLRNRICFIKEIRERS